MLLERKAQGDYSNLTGPLASLQGEIYARAREGRQEAQTRRRGDGLREEAFPRITASPRLLLFNGR